MAHSGVFFDVDQFSCPICLDLLKDPVAIPCGHSYCMDCIKGCWNQNDHVGLYSCPQCRQTFSQRPVLGRNTMLAEVVEKLKKTELQDAPSDHCYAGPGDVVCDVCIGSKKKAVRSCLVCLASYCETDLELHNKLNRGKQHKLIDATEKMQDKICTHHNKLLEAYCRTDQQCICLMCVMDEHKGHDTVSAAAGRTEKQRSAQAAVEDTDSIFTQMIRSLEKRRSELKDVIRAQEKAALSQAEGLLERLEQEIAELRRRNTELEQILQSDDICFLKGRQPLSVPPGCRNQPSVTVNHCWFFAQLNKGLTDLKAHLEESCNNKFTEFSKAAKKVLQATEPKTREEFLQYACQLTVDPSTLNYNLYLSKRNREVIWTVISRTYPDHPDRFNSLEQVLYREGLSGRCYWEVRWTGPWVHIAASYKGISRNGGGDDCGFGRNDKSWSLFCSPSSYSFYHNNEETPVSGPSSSTIGIYLDHRAGTLSFYSISEDTMTLLHRVQTTFTEPLYAGFHIGFKSKVKLCSLT
uniref:Tripartite motif-containing protein 16-like n=1 Tax=Scleropages formosus TaxID=113540 RepID=A0A8C9R4A8_SCLFO